ncbi:MAG TPA: tyrosine-type recombinase/integrase [Pyrinomonadaceae bacterium]|nr:tyrosine-type recombinase/integrase [Pyrinomonadaceae bacterium]
MRIHFQFRKDAGSEDILLHLMLRDTVATLLLRNGVDIRVVQEFLGHTYSATTQRYAHVSGEHLVQMGANAILRCCLDLSPNEGSSTKLRKLAMTKWYQTFALRERMLRMGTDSKT